MNLFDLIDATGPVHVANDDWRPDPLPVLDDRFKEIELDCETNGLRWFDGDRPGGIAIWYGDRGQYIPWGHRGGGNLPEEQVKEWALRELRGKHITNLNTRFDIHMLREWGVDLSEMDCTASDVGHYAALLDDHRMRHSLASLCEDFLPADERKVTAVNGIELDASRMMSYSAGTVAVRAVADVRQVNKLKKILLPRLEAENLMKVKELEDQVIWVVVEMEKNGTLINHELLEEWLKEAEQLFYKTIMAIHKETGMRINPNAPADTAKLLKHLKIPWDTYTAKGALSFGDAELKRVQHPVVQLLREGKKLASVITKLKKYKNATDSKGVMRYALHQLRAQKGEGDEAGETGTITGRFTSTQIVEGVGLNIQQVMKPEKQFKAHGDRFFIRYLHIPEKGKRHLAADAEQIQYRLFAHDANNPRINKAYQENPWISFHKFMWKMLMEFRSDLTYGKTKDVNFAKLFAAGILKIGLMMEFLSAKEYEQLRGMKGSWRDPRLAPVREILKIYDREVPEVKELLERASEKAKNEGYVTTILGRRMRFPDRQRLHKALNGRIQGSEADIMKQKGVELYKVRKALGLTLRFQVHDEYDLDVPNDEIAKQVKEVLNFQSFKLRIPILFNVKTGDSWGDCAREELAELRAKAANG